MIFQIIDSLLGRKKQQVLPEYTCSLSLATMINTFFVEKIDSIRAEFPLLEPTLQPYSFTDIDSIMLNLDKHCCSYMLMINKSLIVTTAADHVECW